MTEKGFYHGISILRVGSNLERVDILSGFVLLPLNLFILISIMQAHTIIRINHGGRYTLSSLMLVRKVDLHCIGMKVGRQDHLWLAESIIDSTEQKDNICK